MTSSLSSTWSVCVLNHYNKNKLKPKQNTSELLSLRLSCGYWWQVPPSTPTHQTPFVRPGNTICHAFLSRSLGSVLETPDTERIDIPHRTPSSSCRVSLCRAGGNPSLSCCQACVGSHTITRLGCKNKLQAERMPCSDHEEMRFACLSSTFLSLTADGFTTGFRKLYLKEMKNKQLLELNQPSVGSLVLYRWCLFLLGSWTMPFDWP